ncbi:MAG: pyrimidine 5'-nucleotidase [Alphaproteobacteria bacterium]|nr:pyrimidine 5'-nucleotidase [Alphaproteobacteria bacterium]
MAPALSDIETWVFDLDNTLYPAASNLFLQVDRRINLFVQRFLRMDEATARATQRRMFQEHGSTLKGLMDLHGLEPAEYLEYVHDIDLGAISPDAPLAAALDRLPGRKLVFTNGSVPYAGRVLERIGIRQRIEAVFAIEDSDYLPKPDPRPYQRLIERHGVVPGRAAMVEDIVRNLEPAAKLGMATIWVPPLPPAADAPAPAAYVQHVAPDLPRFLADIAAPG